MTKRIARALPPPSGRAPVLNILARDVAGLGDELDRYHQRFAAGFVRCEQRHWALKYSQRQMLDLERKSIEPMAVAVQGGNTRSEALQQFNSQGTWSDATVLALHRSAVADLAHNRLKWTDDWMWHGSDFEGYGALRIVQDLLTFPGRMQFDGPKGDRLEKVALQQSHPYARKMQSCLQRIFRELQP